MNSANAKKDMSEIKMNQHIVHTLLLTSQPELQRLICSIGEKMTKQDAKNELNEVSYWKAIVALRTRQLREARLNVGGGAIEYDKVKVMGGDPDGDETQRCAIRIVEAENSLNDALSSLEKAKAETQRKIDLSIDSPLQKTILVMHYIDCIDFVRIPEFIPRRNGLYDYSFDWIYHEHMNAIKKYCEYFEKNKKRQE